MARTRPIVLLSRLVLATIAVSLVALGAQAGAVGDPQLNSLIVQHPVPGWKPISDADLQQIVSFEKQSLSAIGNASVAAQGFKHGHDALLIVVVALSRTLPDPAQQARQGVIGLCDGLTSNPPTSLGSFRGIPDAAQAGCAGKVGSGPRVSLTIFSWVQGNVFAFVFGNGLSTSRIESIAKRQHTAIPTKGVPQPAVSTA